jgi:hypothetical protein
MTPKAFQPSAVEAEAENSCHNTPNDSCTNGANLRAKRYFVLQAFSLDVDANSHVTVGSQAEQRAAQGRDQSTQVK